MGAMAMAMVLSKFLVLHRFRRCICTTGGVRCGLDIPSRSRGGALTRGDLEAGALGACQGSHDVQPNPALCHFAISSSFIGLQTAY